MAKRSKAHGIAKLVGRAGQVKDERVSATSTEIGEVAVGSTAITIGNKSLDSDSVLDFTLDVEPETFTINVDAPDAGQNAAWKWSWDPGTVAYERVKLSNQTQSNVPIYRKGTYTVRNFAARDIHSSMTQTHKIYLKWIEGAGNQNDVSWVTYDSENNNLNPVTKTRMSTQKLTFTVDSDVSPPSLTPPTVSYNVSAVTGAFVFSGSATGNNVSLGPVYKGGVYTFVLDSDTTGHPFYLTSDDGTNFVANSYVGELDSDDGVVGSRNNGISQVVWTVPSNAPSTVYYQCGVHSAMRGSITVKKLEVDSDGAGLLRPVWQHDQEGHATTAEIRAVPTIPSNVCLIYDTALGKFKPQDIGTYLDNTTQLREKITDLVTDNSFDSDSAAVVSKENTIFNISLYQQGELSVTTGTARWYAPFDLQIFSISPKLGTAADDTVTIDVNKNGSSAETFSFAASATTATVTDQTIDLNEGDYITIDVDAIGSTNKGEDLNIQFKYKKI